MKLAYTYKAAAIFILWLGFIQYSSCRAQNYMQAIQFIPKAFHDVKLSFDEHTTVIIIKLESSTWKPVGS